MNGSYNNNFLNSVPSMSNFEIMDNLQPGPGIFSQSATTYEAIPQVAPAVPATPWMETIPVSMPWLKNENIFRGFTAQSYTHNLNSNPPISSVAQMPHHDIDTFTPKQHSIIGCRRKRFSSDIFEDGPQQKQCITEAKMTEKFNMLHIDEKNHSVPVVCAEQQQGHAQVLTYDELEQSLGNEVEFSEDITDTKEPTVIISDELKQIYKAQKQSPPDPSLRKILQPSMAVQLWKPPGGIIHSHIKAWQQKEDDTEDSEKVPPSNQVFTRDNQPDRNSSLQASLMDL